MRRLLCVFIIILNVQVAYSQLLATRLQCKFVRPIMKGFLENHVNYDELNSNLEHRTIDQYIKRLDGSKLYLLSSDIKHIRKIMNQNFTKIGARDCASLSEVQSLYIKRVNERVKFAKNYLTKKIKINKKLSFVFDPEQREYPSSEKEADKFQEKYMQFQLANFLATDLNMKEAKAQLGRRYERLEKRVLEMGEEDIFSNYIDSFAHALDPHSSFFSREALEDFDIQMGLSLEGIGATLSSQDGYTVIEQLIAGGAAKDSGELQTKDKIIAVGQGKKGKLEPIYDMDLRDVVRKIRGKSGSQVRLKIFRKAGGKNNTFEVVLERRKISLESEAAQISYVKKKINGKDKKIGVLHIPSFYSDALKGGRSVSKDVEKLLKEVNKEKVDGLVLDLSNNGGGSLDDAVKVAGFFFKTGNVVETQGNKLKDTDSDVQYAGPLVVLTNRLSASASEIVAGALQDYKRAVVVGSDHTFGKGSVQSVIRLPKLLGAIKVTVGLYYIPGGNSTQHMGIESDVVLPDKFATDEIGEKSLDYSLPPKSLPKFVSKSAFVTEGEKKWLPVTDNLLNMLRKKSKARVKKSASFAETRKEIKEAKKKKKTIKISEILDPKSIQEQKDKEKERNLSKAEKKAKYLERPEIEEAVNVISDMLTMNFGPEKLVTQKAKKQ